MKVNLTEITNVIRSKNSGPYELTFDLIFLNREIFTKICYSKQINPAVICELYKIDQADIINIVEFLPANAIKITIKRPICSGDLGETDVYGAQQHAPLLGLVVDIE
jgi:hypothetical protein